MRFRRVWTRIERFIKLPFQDLTDFERLIQYFRFSSSILIVVFGLIIDFVPVYRPAHLYMGKLNTLKADIAQGVFTVLKDNVDTTGINNDVGLTTSEILVLTSYTFEQVQDIPEYIIVTSYGSCNAEYTDSNTSGDDYIEEDTLIWDMGDGTNMVCTIHGPGFIFDYKTALSAVGLDIVLEYAYGSANSAANGGYTYYIGKIGRLKKHVLQLFYSLLGLEGTMILLTLWYYFIKGRRINIFTEAVLLHLLSFMALFVFMGGTTSVACLLYINFSMQQKITKELEAFGFSYEIGKAWTACNIFWIILVSVGCLMWSGLEWCVTATDRDRVGDMNQTFLENGENSLPNGEASENTNSNYLKLLPNRYDGSTTTLASDSAFASSSTLHVDNQYQQVSERSVDNNGGPYNEDSDIELQSIEFRSSGESIIRNTGSHSHHDDDADDENIHDVQKMAIPTSIIQF